MACKYSDGTDIHIGDTVTYESLDYEPGRGYGMGYSTKKAKVREIKVVMENGDMERPSKLTKISSGSTSASNARAAGEGSARKSRKTRKQRRNH